MKCIIPNYIPHKVKYPNYSLWLSRYKFDLINLYDSFYKIVSDRYEEDQFTPSQAEFLRFTKFIYSCSSKHIQD